MLGKGISLAEHPITKEWLSLPLSAIFYKTLMAVAISLCMVANQVSGLGLSNL